MDPVGNRQTATSTISGLAPVSGTYNADDQLAGETCDTNGNVTGTGGKSFTYDSENRLTSMNGGAVTIVYDGDGNRVAKTVAGVTTRYLVDDLNPTGYPQVIEEVASGVVQREYTYGLQRISENQLVSGAWTASFFGYDGMGSVRQLTNSAGAVTDTYNYDAFGNKISSTGSTPNNIYIAVSNTIRTSAFTIFAPDTTTRQRVDSSAAIQKTERLKFQQLCTNIFTRVMIQSINWIRQEERF